MCIRDSSNINDVVFPFVRDVLFTQEGLQLDDYFEKAYLSDVYKRQAFR